MNLKILSTLHINLYHMKALSQVQLFSLWDIVPGSIFNTLHWDQFFISLAEPHKYLEVASVIGDTNSQVMLLVRLYFVICFCVITTKSVVQ